MTKEQLLGVFGEFGAEDETFTYQTQEETGSEKGGRAFFQVQNDDAGDKLIMQYGEEGFTVGDHKMYV